MRILIIQDGITTELSCPDTLAGFVFALKDHFDNIEKGRLSAVWDKTLAPYKKPAVAIIKPSLTKGKETP